LVSDFGCFSGETTYLIPRAKEKYTVIVLYSSNFCGLRVYIHRYLAPEKGFSGAKNEQNGFFGADLNPPVKARAIDISRF
jgi:hypothetical protein